VVKVKSIRRNGYSGILIMLVSALVPEKLLDRKGVKKNKKKNMIF